MTRCSSASHAVGINDAVIEMEDKGKTSQEMDSAYPNRKYARLVANTSCRGITYECSVGEHCATITEKSVLKKGTACSALTAGGGSHREYHDSSICNGVLI